MNSQQTSSSRLRPTDGHGLVEALVATALLGGAALGLAASLGQARELALTARLRTLERAVLDHARVELAEAPSRSWEEIRIAGQRCWQRVTQVDPQWVWLEARCGVAGEELPSKVQSPGLLVRR